MLTIAQVLPGGVADSLFEEGDILVSADGETVANYVTLEAILDASLGKTLVVNVVRQGEKVSLDIPVADLHALSPDRFLEIGNSVFQNMSIQHSRAMNLPQQGVVVVASGYFLNRADISAGSIITELDGTPLDSIDDLLAVLQSEQRSDKMLARFIEPGREFTSSVGQIDIDDRWFGHQQCERVDDVRFWNCENLTLAEDPLSDEEQKVSVPAFRDPLLNRVAPALVRVDFHIPHVLDNVYANHFSGVGLVVDADEGLIAVDRNTVPIGLGDAEVTFFGSTIIDAQVVFLHPVHNIALLKYDPALLNGAEFEALELQSGEEPLGDSLYMIGYR